MTNAARSLLYPIVLLALPAGVSAQEAGDATPGGDAEAATTGAGASAAASGTAPVAAVLETEVADERDGGLGNATERVLRARLDALDVVRLEGTPALNLDDLQLAVGCVAETETCLREVAGQLEMESLFLSSVERADDTVVLTITFFDARDGGGSQSVVRRASGETAANELIAEVDPMIRELFDLPPPEEPIEPEPLETGPATVEPSGPSVLPFVVAGVGVATLAGGVVMGLIAESTEGDYADAPTRMRSQVDDAIALRDEAETQATIANILLGVGGAIAVTGGVLFVLELGGGDAGHAEDGGPAEAGEEGDAPQEPGPVAVTPWVGPGGAGSSVAGTFEGGL